MLKHCAARAILTAASACAVVAFAPIAGADDPCEQRPPDQQQQCQQDPGAAIPNQVGDAAGQIGKAGLRVLINGVDTCLPVGVPAPIGADVRVVPGDKTGHCTVGQN